MSGLAVAHLFLLVSAFADWPVDGMRLVSVVFAAGLCVTFPFWLRSQRRRVRPISSYLTLALGKPGARGPSRDEPAAVAAFVAAQSLPYRLAAYAGVALLFSGVTAVALGRTQSALSVGIAQRWLASLAITCALGVAIGVLFFRRILAPLVRHLGSRHHLPPDQIRARLGLGTKLLLVFVVVGGVPAGLVALLAMAPASSRLSVVLVAFFVPMVVTCVLVTLVVRQILTPLRALGDRAEELAAGELARPLPPSLEADELGRLGAVFEEMRRALRDRLRSTESINIDLEREVRRRTDALEAKNMELRDALDRLKRAQADVLRNEKLASMGRLVAGIAHEINNPMNAVINSLGPLTEAIAELGNANPKTRAEIEEMLRVIQRGADRTRAIVQALHNYSRADEKIERDVDLARSVDDCVDLLRHRARGVQIVKNVPAGLSLRGFPGQIDQVLMNLMTNAIQALGEKGGTIEVGGKAMPGVVELWVKDDGPGIPPEAMTKIFDPFFTTKDVGEGSGLGLSIVFGIVERHGGQIRVESSPGQGATFRMTFPQRT